MDPFDLTFTDPHHPFHLHHMEMCLEEARVAADEDEVPIGALIVHPEMGVIGLAHNMREQLDDPTAHAELIAMTQAGKALKSWRLDQCILYVTLEPCPMCAGAVVNGRVAMVVYGAADPKAGACDTLYQIPSDPTAEPPRSRPRRRHGRPLRCDPERVLPQEAWDGEEVTHSQYSRTLQEARFKLCENNTQRLVGNE